MQADVFAGPVGRRRSGELGAIVATQDGRIATLSAEAVKVVNEVVAGYRAVQPGRQGLAGARSMIDTIQACCPALARLSIRTQLGGFALDGHTNSRNSVSTKPIDAASAVFRSRISETKRLGRFRVAAFRVSHSCMREPPSEPSGSASTALTTSR